MIVDRSSAGEIFRELGLRHNRIRGDCGKLVTCNAGLTPDPDGAVCYQTMSCEVADLLEQRLKQWRVLMEFDVVPVNSSAEAVRRFSV